MILKERIQEGRNAKKMMIQTWDVKDMCKRDGTIVTLVRFKRDLDPSLMSSTADGPISHHNINIAWFGVQ